MANCNCKSTVTISLEDYEKLLSVQKTLSDLKEELDKKSILIYESPRWFDVSSVRVLNPSDALMEMKAKYIDLLGELNELREKPVPIFNMPATKVKHLK